MVERIELRYTNDRLQIGMVDSKHVYQFSPSFTPLLPETHRGKLVYRLRGSSRRISYDMVKKGLVKQVFIIEQLVPDWL